MPQHDFATLFDWLPLGAYRSSLQGRQLRANPALVRLNGFDSEAEMLAAVDDIAGRWYVQPGRREAFRALLDTHGEVHDFVSEVYRYILDDSEMDHDIRRLKPMLANPPDAIVITNAKYREHCAHKPWCHWFQEDAEHMAHPYEAALETFLALDCRDVGRIDLRMDAHGNVYVLELNPLPGLTPDWSDLVLIGKAINMDYRTLIAEILAGGLKRLREKRRGTMPPRNGKSTDGKNGSQSSSEPRPEEESTDAAATVEHAVPVTHPVAEEKSAPRSAGKSRAKIATRRRSASLSR